MIKIIAIDIDGTLVNSKKILTEKVSKAIDKTVNKNIIVSIASGRPLSGIIKYLDVFKDVPLITYNGAMVITKNRKVLYEKHINLLDVEKIKNYFYKQNPNLNIIIWNDNRLYVNKYNDTIKQYEANSNAIASVYDGRKLDKVNKIIICGNNNDLRKIKKYLENQALEINCEFSSEEFLELYHKDASKGNALKFICDMYGFSGDDASAIGDNYNDLSMLEFAKYSVAMGNSPEEIKSKCKFITKTNDEDGVAYFLDKYC